MNLVHDINFDHSYSFIFSPRPGTPAAKLADETPMDVKKQRLKILQDRLILQAQRISAAMLGTTQRILIEAPSKKRDYELMGRTENCRIVNIAENDPALIGKMVDVKITEVRPNSLRAELIRT